MSNMEIVNSISDAMNKSFNEINNNLQTTENKSNYIRSKVSTQSTQFKSLLSCGGPRLQELRYDIDVNYAIGLLKKEDENVNVYSHLQNILNKILSEKPSNPLENFEKYSIMLKRTYIHNDANFERVFVDNINRNYCFKSLQMYKCASKKQFEQQKQYNKNKRHIRKSEIEQREEKNTMNNVNSIVQVQNLCEVNYMFNKAGFGLPMDEATLIYLTMNEMAQLNKFESIRFWGKIFGIKKIYYVIECKWSNAELERKLLTVKNVSHNSKSSKQIVNDVTHDNLFQQETKSIDTENSQETVNECQSIISSLDDEMAENSIDQYDSWISLNDSDSCKTTLKSSTKTTLEPEMIGVGANKNVYFVTNKLNTKWIELESVEPHHIVEAKKIKRYFTGKLKNPINSFPKFNGLENEYLRAQIARISSSTQISPRGYYIIDEKDKSLSGISDKKSSIALNSSIKKNDDLVRNENFKPISNNNLTNLSYWVHKNPHIDINGVTNKLGFSTLSDLNKNEDDFEELEEEEKISFNENIINSKDDLFGNVGNDISVDNTSAWKGVLCSPLNSRYSYTIMKSHIWPGAFAVAYDLQTDYMYIGWGQKQDSTKFYSIFMKETKLENVTIDSNSTVECQEITKIQKSENEKHSLRKNKNKNIFPRKYNLKAYKGGEKVITYYTYE
ncbi:radial spoke head protein 4 homolog A-like [Melanaphis sacchari]|uniref:radial spoke head protein 4 homolog A-like n=1 Tax=Melanaphis sacchari TaxID=742174 RepID=UPI000DC1599C|nr:radial spoke head protein 4 homolog A-like [Melanaphis sacchari]